MSKETNVLLGHGAENDGIEEYDNPLPTWWLGLFYFTIVWGAVYGVHYHFIGGRSQAGEYDAEVAAFEASKPKTVATGPVSGPDAAAAGLAIFDANCVACHGPGGKGLDAAGNKSIGPDLTDATWIHGGTLADIEKTITVGVPDKGMITWGPVLGEEKIKQVAAYVHAAGGGQ